MIRIRAAPLKLSAKCSAKFCAAFSIAITTSLWCSLTSAAVAGSSVVLQRINVESFGIYQSLAAPHSAFEADSTAGYASVIRTRSLKETHQIPLQKKVVFGFTYSIADASVAAEWVPVSIKVTHPQTADYLGQFSTGFIQSSAAHLKADGRYHNGAFYIFSETNEMVPGEWVITVIYKNDVAASQSFQVFDAELDVAADWY